MHVAHLVHLPEAARAHLLPACELARVEGAQQPQRPPAPALALHRVRIAAAGLHRDRPGAQVRAPPVDVISDARPRPAPPSLGPPPTQTPGAATGRLLTEGVVQ